MRRTTTATRHTKWVMFYVCSACDIAGEKAALGDDPICPECGTTKIAFKPGRWRIETPPPTFLESFSMFGSCLRAKCFGELRDEVDE